MAAIIHQMISLQTNHQEDDIHQKTDRNSSSTNTSESPEAVELPLMSPLTPFLADNLRLSLFEGNSESIEISPKLNQRAVSWMITLCWSKNFNQECLWSTLLLYYSYKCRRNIKKQELELVMLSCLSLSIKLTEHKSYSAKQIAAMGNKDYSFKDIVQKQACILQLVDFNAIIPHKLNELYFDGNLSGQKRSQILLICELLMVKDHSIFFHQVKLDEIACLLGAGQKQIKLIYPQLRQEIKLLMQLKQCKIILNKYSSKFNTDQLKLKFL